ncbi:MAG: D-lyxose/D-mannose family sugar isomerase [Cytophagales bacterium]|nr:D-lyxose/D-mannose family sugar isomerase [Cytophagales bacterium]
MKRSEINAAYNKAKFYFEANGWAILPHFRWDVTDFGLDKFTDYGLVLINLCEEPEYCEKLMYASHNQKTPAHFHKKKKEDIICRSGVLAIKLWNAHENEPGSGSFSIKINNTLKSVQSQDTILLKAGERITIQQGIWHEFWPESPECIIGEVSTANDDLNDNFFHNPDIGRYPQIDENEVPVIKLISDKP